jgi:predicted DNA binding CopG/RHH family protein
MTKLTPEERNTSNPITMMSGFLWQRRLRMAELKSYAKETLTQDQKITLRLSSLNLEALQAKAIEEGIPYQTLISSILHNMLPVGSWKVRVSFCCW